MAYKIQLRRDTAANWTRVNPVLSDGEPGLDLDSNRIKYGDGTTPWQNLPYASSDRLSKGTHQLVLDDNGTLVVSAPNLLIDFGPGTDPYWVAEYGGLGANTVNASAYGAGAFYDSQGNLYILGTASSSITVADSLLLKYDPQGNLLWHKTWHDYTGSSCGATNVAGVIDQHDRIYWVANDWFAGGCWTGYQDTDGNLGLAGTAQAVLGFTHFNPADVACDNLGNYYIAGTWNSGGGSPLTNGIPLVVKVNGNTGAVAWSSDITPQDSNNDSTTGTFRAITVDPNTGDAWAIGDYLDLSNRWSMLVKWNNAGTIQWIKKLNTSVNDIGESVVYNNGHVYTVVNDSFDAKTVVSKFDLDGVLLWAASLATGNNPAPQGYDLSFDSANNVYLTGILANNLWLTKLDPFTGAMVYVRTVSTLSVEAINDGQSDYIVGHRVSNIYQDKIAIVAMTYGNLTQPGTELDSRIIVAQLPIDGSITGTFNNVFITDATSALYSNCTIGTYSLTTLSWSSGTVGRNISSRSQLSASAVTVISGMSSEVIGIGTGSRSSTWNFGADGTLVFPDNTIQTTAWTGSSGSGVGSFGTDLGVGPNYATNNPAILFSDDDMLIRTGGTTATGGGGYGAMDIVAGEEIYVGVPLTAGSGLADLTGHPTYGAYLYAQTNYGSGTEIQLVAGTNTLTVNSVSGITYNNGPISANTAETAFDANGIYNNAGHDTVLSAFWDSGPGYSYVTVPSDTNSANIALQLVNAKESGGGVQIITSNPNNGNTRHTWTFSATGNLTTAGSIALPANSEIAGGGNNVEIIADSASWVFGNDGNLTLPVGGNITSLAGYVGTAVAINNVNVAAGSNVVTVATSTAHGLGEGDKITITGISGSSTHELNNGLYYTHVVNSGNVTLYTDSALTVPVDGGDFSQYFTYVNRTMTPVNSLAFSQNSPFNNTALHFDGSSNFVQIHDNSSVLALGAFTWEAWVNFSSTQSGTIWHQSYYGNGYAFVIYFYQGSLWFVVGNGPNMYLDSTTISPLVNNWGHLVINRDSSNNVTFFVNGSQVSVAYFVPGTGYTTSSLVPSCENTLATDWVSLGLGIQNPQLGGHYYNGKITGIRVSNISRYSGNFTANLDTVVNDAHTVFLMSMTPHAPLQDSSGSNLLIDTNVVIQLPYNGNDNEFQWTVNIPGSPTAWTQGIFLLQSWAQGTPLPDNVNWYVSIGTTTTGTVTGADNYSGLVFENVTADPGPYGALHIAFTTANAFHAGDTLTLTSTNSTAAPTVTTSIPSAIATHGSINTADGFLATPASPELSITGDYTFECWFYATSFSATASNDIIFSSGGTTDTVHSTDNGVQFGFVPINGVGGAGILYSAIVNGSGNGYANALSSPLAANTWHHLAVSAQGATITFWIDGAQVWSRSNVFNNIASSGSPAAIGYGPTNSLHTFQGLVADVRFITGTGLYSSSQSTISVPTEPYTATSGTKLLLLTNNSGNYTLDSSLSAQVSGGGNVLKEFRSADLTIEVGAVTAQDSGSIHFVSGANTWTMDGTGKLTLPGGQAVIRSDSEFRIWSTDVDITVYRNGQDGYSIKNGEVDVFAGNSKITKTTTSGLELVQGHLKFPDASLQTTAYNGIPPTVVITSTPSASAGEAEVQFTVTSNITVTEVGAIFMDVSNTQHSRILTDTAGTGSFTISTSGLNITTADTFFITAYAVNAVGTGYSAPRSKTITPLCLIKGTMVTLSDGTVKAIEDITYNDKILVWDFDRACYATSTPLWIKRAETASAYNLLTFSDGSTVRTINQHRIFNAEAGAFTYPMTDDTPIGTTTFNVHGEHVTLVSKQVIVSTVEYYNVITKQHINLFADDILTSCRFNNVYPIANMKFVKDHRALRTRNEFANISDRFYHGLRLSEQTFDIDMIESYVQNLIDNELTSCTELAN